MEISAKLVKELREKTGAGMMDCKKALVESNGDVEVAAEYLRKKGLMDASKKASRTAADGLIAFELSKDLKKGSMVEVNSETDFVAKGEKFQDLVTQVAHLALIEQDVEKMLSLKFDNSSITVKEEIDSLIAVVGENMNIRRATALEVKEGVICAYVHNAVSKTLGKIGVLVAFESHSKEQDKLIEFGKKIAMHIAAANPSYLCEKCVPENIIEKEKEITIAQAKEIGKNEEIAIKMAEGRIKKFFEEVVLLDQAYVIDPKTKIKDVVSNFAKELGCDLKLSGFKKFVLGEGIEKKENNFAEEVMSFVK